MLEKLVGAVIETVTECGGPAPESMIHMAFEQKGIPSYMTRLIIDSAIQTGKVRRAHHALYPTQPTQPA